MSSFVNTLKRNNVTVFTSGFQTHFCAYSFSKGSCEPEEMWIQYLKTTAILRSRIRFIRFIFSKTAKKDAVVLTIQCKTNIKISRLLPSSKTSHLRYFSSTIAAQKLSYFSKTCAEFLHFYTQRLLSWDAEEQEKNLSPHRYIENWSAVIIHTSNLIFWCS